MERFTFLADGFREWADSFGSSNPMYAEIARDASAAPEVLELLAEAPAEQQLPVLLFAAVHAIVLREPDLALASYYPSVRGIGAADGRHAASAAFRQLCIDRADEIRRALTTRTVQTNEVGRCRFYLPAMAHLAAEVGPLSLVDVGASAGLNLHLDRFSYTFRPGGEVGGPSPVHLTGELRGTQLPEHLAAPVIVGRLGVDRSPLDLSDPDDRTWLRACVWPEQLERFQRLDAAIEIARADPVEIRRGDATPELAGAVARAGLRHGHPVVMNSWVLNYLTTSERFAYVSELERIGAATDLSWVYAEAPRWCAGLPFPATPARDDLTVLMLVTWRAGGRAVRHLADCHPHGEWLVWRDQAIE